MAEVAASEEAASAEGEEVSVVDGEVAVSSDELIRRMQSQRCVTSAAPSTETVRTSTNEWFQISLLQQATSLSAAYRARPCAG